jgi:RNA polymerase sigma factor (sigma-70 family)
VRRLQDDIYRLALRFRWDPEDAADATQEVLTRVVTHLGTWRGEASVRTWAWRIAVNHLRDRAPTPFERAQLSFEAFAADLADGLEPQSPSVEVDQTLLAEEVKLGCTLGMLQCLDRDQRLAYVLGDVFELSSDEAARVSGTTPATHRKRLSRARSRLRHFVGRHCGLVNEDAACRCALRINRAVELGRVDPTAPRLAPVQVQAMERLHDLASLMRSHPEYRLPPEAWIDIDRLLYPAAEGD